MAPSSSIEPLSIGGANAAPVAPLRDRSWRRTDHRRTQRRLRLDILRAADDPSLCSFSSAITHDAPRRSALRAVTLALHTPARRTVGNTASTPQVPYNVDGDDTPREQSSPGAPSPR